MATLAKLVPLGLFIVLAFIAFRMDVFKLDFSGVALGVPVWEQVKNTMLITLWVFIGVEGAVVVSARARNKRDKASRNHHVAPGAEHFHHQPCH